MTSFEEEMRAAQGRRQREAEEQARKAAQVAEWLSGIRTRANELMAEINKAVATLRESGRRQGAHPDWWYFSSGQAFFDIKLGEVVVTVDGRKMPLAEFATEGFFAWTDERFVSSSWESTDYTVTADEAMEGLLVSIADFLTRPS